MAPLPKRFALACLLLALAAPVQYSNAVEPADVNYEEARVPAYPLSDPLVGSDGARVANPTKWRNERRHGGLKSCDCTSNTCSAAVRPLRALLNLRSPRWSDRRWAS